MQFARPLALRLANDPGAGALEGQRREIATLFTDITSFTALVEMMTDEDLALAQRELRADG